MRPRLEDWIYIHYGYRLALPDYFLMLCVSLLLGVWLLLWYTERRNLNKAAAYSFLCLAIPLLFFGAKVFYAAQFPKVLGLGWEFWRYGGVSLYGGLVGVLVALFLTAWLYRLEVWPYLDGCALSFALGLAVTRIGCFLSGCNWGTPTDLPWGVRYPQGSDAFRAQVGAGIIEKDAWLSVPVHPTQLYESLFGAVLFVIGLLWLRRRPKDGRIFIAFLSGYAVFRFLEEYLRDDLGPGVRSLFSFSQIISLGFLACVAAYLMIGWWLFSRSPRQTAA